MWHPFFVQSPPGRTMGAGIGTAEHPEGSRYGGPPVRALGAEIGAAEHPARADLAEEFEESQGDRAFPGIYGAGISQCEGCGRWGLQNKVGGTGGGRAIG